MIAVLEKELTMLRFIILLCLCLNLGDAFPQRSKPEFESNFDFDSYLEHFTEQTFQQIINEHPIARPNQDYRYMPLLGERPDYIPPLLRTHVAKKPVIKQRAWHSSYQDGNFQRPAIGHAVNIQPLNRENLQRTHNSLSAGNSNFHLHSKIEDFGIHEASDDDDYDIPLVEPVDAPLKEKPVFNKDLEDYEMVDYEDPVVVSVESERTTVHPDYDEYDLPVVEPVVKISRPEIKTHGHSSTGVKLSSTVKSVSVENPKQYDSMDYEEPVIALAKETVIALTKETSHHKKNSPKIPNFEKVKRPNVNRHSQKRKVMKATDVPVSTSDPEEYETKVSFSKKSEGKVHKEHNRRPIRARPVNMQVKKSTPFTWQPIMPSYTESIEATYSMEALTNKESVSVKEHSHKIPITSKPVIIKHEENPIIEPSLPADPSYPEDDDEYDLPMVEVVTREGSIYLKDHKKDKLKTEKPNIKDYHEGSISLPSEKPLVSVYPEVYDDLSEVEILSKKEKDHKLTKQKKQTRKPVIKPGTVPSYTKDYKFEESTMTAESESREEYDTYDPVTSQFDHKEIDYEYEDSNMKDQTFHESKGPGQKTIRTTNAYPVTESKDEYSTEPIYQENDLNSKITKNENKRPVSEGSEIKRIVKREVGLDYEDYDLPLVEPVPKEHEIKLPEQSNLVNNPANENHVDDEYDYDLPVVEVVKNPVVIPPNFHKPDIDSTDYDEYDLPIVEVVRSKKPAIEDESLPVTPIVEEPSDINLPVDYDLPIDDHENPNLEELTKDKHVTKEHDHRPGKKTVVKKEPHTSKKPNRKSTTVTPNIEVSNAVYGRYKRERENHGMALPAVTYPSIPEDIYERPIDKYADMNEKGHKINKPIKEYFDEGSSESKKPIHGDFEQLGISDTQVVLDSISINREGPEGREIPVLDVIAVEDREKDSDSGVKVVAMNKENGNVDVINIGHENSNFIEDFADSGSGTDIDERSSLPRNFLPMNSNTWSFMTHVRAQERRKFKPCLTPKNETGNCMPIQMCPVPNIGAGGNIDELLRNICIIDEVFIGICCPEFPVESVRVDWGQSGNPNLEPLSDNGEESPETKECGKLPSTIRDQDPWPWMAPLVSTTSDRVFCGGVLISQNYVLTAAHCTSKIPRNRILVRLSSPDSQAGSGDFAVVEIKRHAQYNPRTMQHDIALLKLSRRVPLDNFRRLVCLPDEDLKSHVGETAVLLRWQRTTRNGIESLPVISNQDCQNRLGTPFGDSVLCTEPRNEDTTCNADSGAPLVIDKDGKFTLTGVLTWNRNDCDGRFPSVFTRISSYRKWIQNHVN